MSNFTKEYIKECDCKEIQGLRENFQEGDWVWARNIKEFLLINKDVELDNCGPCIWLPTGDDLDREIVKIVGNDDKSFYQFYYEHTYADYYKATFNTTATGFKPINHVSTNPLIAKILLLKQLLKEANNE